MKPLLTLLAFLLAGAASAQRPIYRAAYDDSLHIAIDSAMEASVRHANGAENIPEELKEALFKEMLGQISRQHLLLQVTVFADSTVIDVEQAEAATGINLHINNPHKVWRNGSVVNEKKDPAYHVPALHTTGRSKKILEHTCQEYRSEDGYTLLWVAQDLPSGITPGIPTGNLSGAVLEAIIQMPAGGSMHATIISLQRQ